VEIAMRLPTLLTALVVAIAAPAQAIEGGRLTLTHDGATRSAIVDVMPGTADAPLLVVLHGGIGSASMVRRRARVSLARQGWVVAYPEALDDWSDGRVYPSGRPVSTVDDVGFLRAMVDDLAERGLVDTDRVFVAGPSIGGMMALRVLCDAPDLVAGVAIAIASLPVGADCPAGPPRPTLVLHGTADTIVPPEGGRIGGSSILIRERGSVRPIDETMELLVARNACRGVEETFLPDRAEDDTRTRHRIYQSCTAPLEHYVVEGGGHTWPGDRPFRLGQGLVGATSQDFSATRVVESFFAELAQPAP
jgi:polyhydroxybutyrate depolymerase